MQHEPTLDDWIAHVFDRPVTDPAWYWDPKADEWDLPPSLACELMTETFLRSGDLLSPFDSARIAQGLSYLVSPSCSDFMFALVDPVVDLERRIALVRSFVPLFQEIMAQRCEPALSHRDEGLDHPLNEVCYMWWDVIPVPGAPDDPDRRPLDEAILATLADQLAIPHVACRESALHGLGHWRVDDPEAERIIDRFLAGNEGLGRELRSYARAARSGCIQ